MFYNWYSWKRFYQHSGCIKSSASGRLRPEPQRGLCPIHTPTGDPAPDPHSTLAPTPALATDSKPPPLRISGYATGCLFLLNWKYHDEIFSLYENIDFFQWCSSHPVGLHWVPMSGFSINPVLTCLICGFYPFNNQNPTFALNSICNPKVRVSLHVRA